MAARLRKSPPPPDRHVYPFRVSPSLWRRFLETCRDQDKTANRVLTRFVASYVADAEQNGGAR